MKITPHHVYVDCIALTWKDGTKRSVNVYIDVHKVARSLSHRIKRSAKGQASAVKGGIIVQAI